MKKIYFLTFLLFPFYLWAVDDSISSYMNLEEVVVSAIRVSEKTPISHSNIEQKEIQSNNYGQDIPYLIQNTPSVVVTSDAGNGVGYTDIRIRGVDASRINVTTNGVPMNDAESHKMSSGIHLSYGQHPSSGISPQEPRPTCLPHPLRTMQQIP